jgi:hypothetical protein
LVLVVLVWPCVARAEEPADSPWNRKFSLDAMAGLGTPVGFGGVVVGVTPVPWFTIEVGGGASGSGPQGALMLRARQPEGEVRVGFAAGASVGPYQSTKTIDLFDTSLNRFTWDVAVWLNAELSIEKRWATGLEVRGFLGAGAVMNSPNSCVHHDAEAGTGEDHPCDSGTSADGLFTTVVPYIGVAVGYAFGP